MAQRLVEVRGRRQTTQPLPALEWLCDIGELMVAQWTAPNQIECDVALAIGRWDLEEDDEDEEDQAESATEIYCLQESSRFENSLGMKAAIRARYAAVNALHIIRKRANGARANGARVAVVHAVTAAVGFQLSARQFAQLALEFSYPRFPGIPQLDDPHDDEDLRLDHWKKAIKRWKRRPVTVR